ncbi:pro-glucagon-like [Myotis daubentonii]|uniref:pro-glucagon-like n=1 Tax=Myotis daubentonii TaxID=98922 RepID=UPI00287324FE|nr:pro-glucagon-like [Myotis daubentonii]
MKSIYFVAGLFVMLAQGSWQHSPQDTEEKSSLYPAPHAVSLTNLHQIHKEKRNSEEERILSEFDEFLQNECVQEFVTWLLDEKKIGIAKRHDEFERHAEGTFTSDLSSYLEGQAAKEPIAWLEKALGRQELNVPETVRRRHVDGSLSDEMNTVHDILANQEYIKWLLQNKITDRK